MEVSEKTERERPDMKVGSVCYPLGFLQPQNGRGKGEKQQNTGLFPFCVLVHDDANDSPPSCVPATMIFCSNAWCQAIVETTQNISFLPPLFLSEIW